MVERQNCKFAIYTACIGGYDNIAQPEVIDARFDYILFTDDIKEECIGVWQIRRVDYTHLDKTRIARYVKTHPQQLLPNYTATLWMDSSLQIISPSIYNRFIELYENGIDVASVKHPKRDCIYDEAYEVASRKIPGALEYEDIAMQWCHKLWKEGYPQHNGLFETSILFRRNNDTMHKFNEFWWNCIDKHSKRDQLSFNYALWKIQPKVGEFLQNSEHMMNSEKVKYVGHSSLSARKALHLNKLQRIRYNYRVEDRGHALNQWYAYMKMRMPLLWLHTIGTIAAVRQRISVRIKNRIKNLQCWKARHRIFAWPAYGKWVEEIHQDKTHFVPYTDKPYQRHEGDVKIFAYYLTQFHAIPENDEAHGKGFTEWTNVATTQPQYVGHYQPKIPYDLGFYNLLMPGVMERQVEIARAYGIYGFCFYYYWFSGKKVLERPLEYWLEHKEIDFHYHLCWANENWSKLWDGGNKEVILSQELKDGDAEHLFADLLPYFKDERYEKIDNKPILMIYRPSLFSHEDFRKFKDTLQKLAKANGFDGLYLMCSSFGQNDPREWGVDALTEFPPHGMGDMCPEMLTVDRLIPTTTFIVRDVSDYVEKKRYIGKKDFLVYKCCFPSWDNTPRKAWSNGVCFKISDDDFSTWLYDIINWTKENHASNEQYVYINAWNEWGEGAILEPTLRNGYKSLEMVKKCLEKSRT